jgi:flagellar biosynthesis/type III secretory pathway protein FliH
MQKWSPESLVPEPGAASYFVAVCPSAEPPAGAATPAEGPRTRFRSEAGFVDATTLLGHLSREERAQLYDLVELEIAQRYEDRLRQVEEEHRVERERLANDLAQSQRDWQRALTEELERVGEERRERFAREAVELALAVAQKIVRSAVELDPQVLVRAIESVLYKLEAGLRLIVTVNPGDAERLQAEPELAARLRIEEIKSDRRIEPGGCRIEAAEREWDATLKGQLEVLAEAVRESIATGPAVVRAPAETDDDGTGVE